MKKFAKLSIAMFIVLTLGQCIPQTAVAANNRETRKPKIEEKTADRPALKKLEGTVVSQDSKTSFYMNVGNVSDITWTRSTYYDEANYKKDGAEMIAYFDVNGSFVGTTNIKNFSDISSSLQKGIKKLYPDCTPGTVTFFKANEDNTTDMILYGVQFESKTHYFVELTKGDSKFVIMDSSGELSLFKQL